MPLFKHSISFDSVQQNRRAATAVEFGIIAAFILIFITAAFNQVGAAITQRFVSVAQIVSSELTVTQSTTNAFPNR